MDATAFHRPSVSMRWRGDQRFHALSTAGPRLGFETNVVQLQQVLEVKLDSKGATAVFRYGRAVDALIIGPRRAEKIGRLLRERLMRRWVDATGRGTTARRMGTARLRGRRQRRTRRDCRRYDRG
jgi:hypothetical protein